MMEAEEPRENQDTGPVHDATDQSPEEFAKDIESDPAYNPTDEELRREKGG